MAHCRRLLPPSDRCVSRAALAGLDRPAAPAVANTLSVPQGIQLHRCECGKEFNFILGLSLHQKRSCVRNGKGPRCWCCGMLNSKAWEAKCDFSVAPRGADFEALHGELRASAAIHDAKMRALTADEEGRKAQIEQRPQEWEESASESNGLAVASSTSALSVPVPREGQHHRCACGKEFEDIVALTLHQKRSCVWNGTGTRCWCCGMLNATAWAAKAKLVRGERPDAKALPEELASSKQTHAKKMASLRADLLHSQQRWAGRRLCDAVEDAAAQ